MYRVSWSVVFNCAQKMALKVLYVKITWQNYIAVIWNFKFSVYATLYFANMCCLPIVWVNSFVYANEMFSSKWRFLHAGLFGLPMGFYTFTLIAYLNRSWSGIHIWCGIITFCTLPIYFLIPESPRFFIFLWARNHFNTFH